MVASSDERTVLSLLKEKGAMTSVDLQQAIKKSQPTVSRILSGIGVEIIVMGKGPRAQYAAPHPIGSDSPQQPIWLIDALGDAKKIGTLSYLMKNQIAIEADGVVDFFQAELPWYLTSQKAHGFLGRLLAQQIPLPNATSNPELWSLETVLVAALHLHDAPGALRVGFGDKFNQRKMATISSDEHCESAQSTSLDEIAADIAKIQPAGSSAGGEQPKFLGITDKNEHVLVKFSPPRGTPFGDRWTDLLYAESICGEVLIRHGQSAAKSQVVRGKDRTYLISTRFDRIGKSGRKHVVPLGAAHTAFVPGAYANWASTCDNLARQGKLSADDAEAATFLLHFGRLIGNSDMHSGNLSLFARGNTLLDISKGNFSLTPSYDMLPMRWKPDVSIGIQDYDSFGVDDYISTKAVRAAAVDFWRTLSTHPHISNSLKAVAVEMASRIGDDDSEDKKNEISDDPAPDREISTSKTRRQLSK